MISLQYYVATLVDNKMPGVCAAVRKRGALHLKSSGNSPMFNKGVSGCRACIVIHLTSHSVGSVHLIVIHLTSHTRKNDGEYVRISAMYLDV